MENPGINRLAQLLASWPEDKKGNAADNKLLQEVVAEIYDGLGTGIKVDRPAKRRLFHLVVGYSKAVFVVKVFYTKNRVDENRLPALVEQAKAAQADGVVMVSSKAPDPKCKAYMQQMDLKGLTLEIVTFDALLAAKDNAALRNLLLVKKPVAREMESVKPEGNSGKAKSTKAKLFKIGGGIAAAIGVVSGIIGIVQFSTGKDLPDYMDTSTAAASMQVEAAAAVEYFISVAVSDTVSDSLEPTKKIVATASADTTSMTLLAQGEGYTSGPFNMTMDSSRKFSFLAVLEEEGTHEVTITAHGENGEEATEVFTIER